MMNFRGRILFTVIHDLLVLSASCFLALWLRLESASFILVPSLLPHLILFNITTIIFLHRFGLYQGIWKYASINEIFSIFKAVVASSLIMVATLFITIRLENIPRSFPILLFIVSVMGISGPRIFYRLVKDSLEIKNHINQKVNVIIVGDGDTSELFIRGAIREKSSPYNVVAILGIKKKSIGDQIHGIPIIGEITNFNYLERWIEKKNNSIQRIIIADHDLSNDTIEKLFIFAKKNGLAIGEIPRITDLKKTTLSELETNPIEVEDVLGRKQKIHKTNNYKFLKNKVILVTGAGGSIGFELCKQILNFSPKNLILFEQNEFHLYNASEKLKEYTNITSLLGDVRDKKKVCKIIEKFKPNLIFHSAALKHITFVEDDPIEAINTNFIGTLNILEACQKFEVPRMIFISTDKAVNPTTFMGATKRLCEKYIQFLDEKIFTKLKIVRFGNVLGSAGSVIPLFEKQIKLGGPITITHPNVQRYFMTIREAVELVIIASVESSEQEDYGEINILEMGKPVKIKDLAQKMIRLSGQKKDISIKYTKLRKGEKISEQLFYAEEVVAKTKNNSILKTKKKVNKLSRKKIQKFLIELENGNEKIILDNFYNLLPEYKRQINYDKI